MPAARDITAYDIRHILTSATDKADANWTVVEAAWATDPGGDLAYTIAGLTPGLDYDVQVRAVNSAGAGDWSATGAGAAGRFTLVPYDWSLRPDSVAGGQSFRLLFVTSQDPLGHICRPRQLRQAGAGKGGGGP